MGHNVDLTEFGLKHLKCRHCMQALDLTEVDIDCDIKSNENKYFTLNTQCQECHENSEYEFEITLKRQRK